MGRGNGELKMLGRGACNGDLSACTEGGGGGRGLER
jgi:hypothetical protein